MKRIETVFLLVFFSFFFLSCSKYTRDHSGFGSEHKVTILGYTSDAMEPFISKDGKYLFFNNLKGPRKKDIFYAERISDTVFLFKGEVKGANSDAVDANPSMDTNGNFYFTSTRNLQKTVYCGKFANGSITDVHPVEGNINSLEPYWINMGANISVDGKTLVLSTANFRKGESFPIKGHLRIAVKSGGKFNLLPNEDSILNKINNTHSIQYAGELSPGGLELFYSEVRLSNPPVFELLYAKRDNTKSVFGHPIKITAPFSQNPLAVVEAPSISADEKILYYHKLYNGKYTIFAIFRKK